MERARPKVHGILAEHHCQAFFQLVCSLIGKGDRQNLPRLRRVHGKDVRDLRVHRVIAVQITAHQLHIVLVRGALCKIGIVSIAEPDQVCDAVDEHRRFAAARACQN